MTVINIPFIAEVADHQDDSPIGIFEIDWNGDYYSTSAEAIGPMAHDILEGGQAQEDLTKNNPNAKALYDFYLKWDKKHLTLVADFTNEEKAQLKSDIEQLLKHYPVHHIGQEVSLSEGVDMWIEAFPKEASDYFGELSHVVQATVEEAENEDSETAMDELVRHIPGVTDYAAQVYGIADSCLVEADFRMEVEKCGLDALDKYQGIDTASDWHCHAPLSEYFNDDFLVDRVNELAEDLNDTFTTYVEQAEEALKTEQSGQQHQELPF